MQLDAIIFDCDGTLVDSERLGNEILCEYIAEFGVTLSPDEAIEAFRGRRMTECVAELERRRRAPLPNSFVPELRRRTGKAFRERLQPIDGALELVRSLTVPFCVASSGPREKMEISLSVTGLLPLFEGRIFSSYEIGSWKPDPGLFLHAARSMGISPTRCAVVEDSLPGIDAGIAAGMTVFALMSAAPRPDVHIVQSLHELREILEEGNG